MTKGIREMVNARPDQVFEFSFGAGDLVQEFGWCEAYERKMSTRVTTNVDPEASDGP
ncbi:MAG: hypothetical protein NVS3B21_03220 [Acidimicrobiales bacterium]